MTYVTIELTEAEAEQFKLFQEYYAYFAKQLERGVYELSPGRATLDFNSDGELKNIRVEHNYHY